MRADSPLGAFGASPPTVGWEVEWLAPPGRTRADVAAALAGPGGQVRRALHLDAEPSAVPGKPVFHHLVPAFDAVDAHGAPVARCTDDLTLVHGLDARAPSPSGWWRVVGDDVRWLRFLHRHIAPDATADVALQAAAGLLGGRVTAHDGGVRRLEDSAGAPIALLSGVPGERARGCEIVLPPCPAAAAPQRAAWLWDEAARLGLQRPWEGATHLHIDRRHLEDAGALARFVARVAAAGPWLRRAVGTNPRCRHLGPWSDALLATTRAPDFAALSWPEARARLRATEPSKYVDLNLRNLVFDVAGKPTVEWRVFPVFEDGHAAAEALELALAVHAAALDPADAAPTVDDAATWARWCDGLPMSPAARARWARRSSTRQRVSRHADAPTRLLRRDEPWDVTQGGPMRPAFLFLALLTACGGGGATDTATDNGGDGTGGANDGSAFGARYGAAVCDFLFDCYADLGSEYPGTRESCESAYEAAFSTAATFCTYDAAAAADCFSSLESLACTEDGENVDYEEPTACAEVFADCSGGA